MKSTDALNADAQRVSVAFEGRVQGVGFRYTVVEIARQHPVTGFVRNESDGSVTVVAEGRKPVLEAFVADLFRSRLGAYIRGDRRNWVSAQGTFDGFDIRYH